MTWNELLGSLETYGYQAPEADYRSWCEAVDQYLGSGGEEFAVQRLLDLVMSDLPDLAKAVALDDSNAVAALQARAAEANEPISPEAPTVTRDLLGRYLAYLVAIGFLPGPSGAGGKELPTVHLSKAQVEALRQLEGRGALA